MPDQTKKTGRIYYPDGAKVSIKTATDTEWLDVGAIKSTVANTFNYTENKQESSNAGMLATQISAMEIAGGFTLINLDIEAIEKMGGGVFTREVINGAAITSGIADQVIAANWEIKKHYSLDIGNIRSVIKPVITVTPQGEAALVEDTDFILMTDSNSTSGWSLVFLTNTHAALAVTIVYTSVTPLSGEKLHAGSSSVILKPYAMRIAHTDSNGKVRAIELYSVISNSGGFQFNFKGSDEDGLEEMPLTYTASLDTSRDNGKQLFTWSLEY